MVVKKLQKVAKKYNCLSCDYVTSRKSSFDKHCATGKHEMVVNGSKKLQKVAKSYECECGKIYTYNSGYYRHKRTCCITNEEKTIDETEEKLINKDEMLISLLKQNSEMLEIIKTKMNETTTMNSHNNNNNNTFNLQFFLNETCKDAMNINDFVESIKVQLEDLVNLGKVGYVEGISNIIVKNLKILEVNQRPIHCTDKKRETIYVKQEDKWEKEDEEKKRLRKLIKDIAYQNQILIPQFRKMYPDCGRAESHYAGQFTRLVIESMGGSGDNDEEKEDKIIKKITNVVGIERIKA